MDFLRANTKIDILEDYYQRFPEENRLKTRHGMVEYYINCCYLKKYIIKYHLKKILDCGAGTGAYISFLESLGVEVWALEYTKHNLKILRKNHPETTSFQGDARELKNIEDGFFDGVVLFGPLYHLLTDIDKEKALSETKRVVRSGGIIFESFYMNEYAIISYGFKKHNIKKSIEEKRVNADYKIEAIEDDLFSFVRIKDIKRYNNHLGLNILKMIASDGPSDYMRKELNELSEEEFAAYLEYILKIAEDKYLLGASSHVMVVVRKD